MSSPLRSTPKRCTFPKRSFERKHPSGWSLQHCTNGMFVHVLRELCSLALALLACVLVVSVVLLLHYSSRCMGRSNVQASKEGVRRGQAGCDSQCTRRQCTRRQCTRRQCTRRQCRRTAAGPYDDYHCCRRCDSGTSPGGGQGQQLLP